MVSLKQGARCCLLPMPLTTSNPIQSLYLFLLCSKCKAWDPDPLSPFILPFRLKETVPALLLTQPQWSRQRHTASSLCYCFQSNEVLTRKFLYGGEGLLHTFNLCLGTHTHSGGWFDSWCPHSENSYSSLRYTSTAGSRNGLATTIYSKNVARLNNSRKQLKWSWA